MVPNTRYVLIKFLERVRVTACSAGALDHSTFHNFIEKEHLLPTFEKKNISYWDANRRLMEGEGVVQLRPHSRSRLKEVGDVANLVKKIAMI